ncbi:MAG: hypothetical protein U5R48_19085 [Gammaproteobacteria bacterium]|nr:hypothetical protein [Gammaproteobacteria bacterium]
MTQSSANWRGRGVGGVLLGSALAVATPYAQQALAAEQEQATNRFIEEVIVSAQRREESIQDVPIAASAFSGAMLEDKQIITPSDLQMNAPNVSFTSHQLRFGSSFSDPRHRQPGDRRQFGRPRGAPSTSTRCRCATNLNAAEFYDMEQGRGAARPPGHPVRSQRDRRRHQLRHQASPDFEAHGRLRRPGGR